MATVRAAVSVPLAPGQGFARPRNRQMGNDLPADSGWWGSTYYGEDDKPGPSQPSAYRGYVIDGTGGAGNDGAWGTDPRQPPMSPSPRRVAPVIEGQASNGAGADAYAPQGVSAAPLGYAEGAARDDDGDTWGMGWAARLARSGDPLPHGRQSYWRGGIQGFSDKLTVKDRHAYWDTGNQRSGTEFSAAGAPSNTYNNPLQERPRPDLRTINRTVSYQKGTDWSRNFDDLSRGYTWLGEQGSGYSPVYGGVPGLYTPYGSRGGVPYPIVDPTGGSGGRELVWAGPPHGYHSATFPDGADTLRRFVQLPQMRPVRVDRPSNSPQAGQSFSQTVQHQGMPARTPAVRNVPQTSTGTPLHHTGRGWAGQTWRA